MEQIYAQTEGMPYGCGVNIFGQFVTKTQALKDYGEWNVNYYCGSEKHLEIVEHCEAGAGFSIAAFIDNEICKEAYEILKKRFKILYESPKRVNDNTNNLFYFCVYDTTEQA